MKHVSLFSGFGGFDLGFQRAGIETVAFCENNDYCQKVLHKHWPEVPICPSIQKFPEWWKSVKQDGETYIVTAGFPCQPFSFAGKKKGIEDHRWLWPETFAAICAIRPKYIFLENVAALTSYGEAIGQVFADINSLGFNAEWGVISATEFGALHYRNRLIVLSYPDGGDGGEGYLLASGRVGAEFNTPTGLPRPTRTSRWKAQSEWRKTEPGVSRMVDGVSAGLVADRLRGLGNAIVPQVAEYYARYILAIEEQGVI